MNQNQVLAAALAKLLESDNGAPASAFTPAQRKALEDLARKTGALRLRSEGRGNIYEAVRRELLSAHLLSLRPMSQTDPGLPKRAANIGASRSSKCASHGHGRYYLLMKSVRDGVAWRDGRGRVFDLAEATQVAGAGVLALAAQDDWVSGQPLWLVENQALFDRLDWMPDAARGSVAYYAGQIPEFLLNWLAARPRAEQTVLFPDYDGVGLLNFARLRKRCACPCSFWLMPDWKNRLRRFGNKEIWVNTLPNFHAALAELRSSGMDESLADFCQVLSREGLALEQEAIWL